MVNNDLQYNYEWLTVIINFDFVIVMLVIVNMMVNFFNKISFKYIKKIFFSGPFRLFFLLNVN
jgi:hypothetical protein